MGFTCPRVISQVNRNNVVAFMSLLISNIQSFYKISEKLYGQTQKKNNIEDFDLELGVKIAHFGPNKTFYERFSALFPYSIASTWKI